MIQAALTLILLTAGATDTPKHLSILNTSLHTSYRSFTQAHPDIKCRTLEPTFKTCTTFGSNVFGVRSSRLNFNFENGTLTNVAVFFYPAPEQSQQLALLESLKREYGKPKQDSGYHGQVIYRWSEGKTVLQLMMPTTESQQLNLILFVPED